MYKLTTSVPSFQNVSFYNNFWFTIWKCNIYFYGFKFKASQHPAFFFFFQSPSTVIYGHLRKQKGKHQWTTNASSTFKQECFTPLTMVRPFLNKRVTHCLFSSPGGGVLPCPSITKSSCSICKGKHCRSEIGGAKCTSPTVALFHAQQLKTTTFSQWLVQNRSWSFLATYVHLQFHCYHIIL